MTDEQRKRIHDITYSTDDRAELAERIVALEDERDKLRMLAKAAWGCVKHQASSSCDVCRMVFCGCTLQSAMRELGVEADE